MSELKEYTQILWDFLALSDEPTRADVIFVFGGSTLASPDRAAKLYYAGFAGTIIVTGKNGVYGNPAWEQPTAMIFAEHLISLRIPENAILVAPNSTNTLEDVLFGVGLLREHLIALKEMILVSRPLHQRRAYAIMYKQFPTYHYLNCPSEELSPSQIEKDKDIYPIAKRALEEIDRVKKYGIWGSMDAQEIPLMVEEAYMRIDNILQIHRENWPAW
jgi:DUF218 domain